MSMHKVLSSVTLLAALLGLRQAAQAQVPTTVTMGSGTTTVTTCNALFYDSGGASNSYTDNQTLRTRTFATASSAPRLQFIFTLNTTEQCCDFLKMYDGANSSTGYIGTVPPVGAASEDPVVITSSTSRFTFSFTSDYSVTGDWKASVGCLTGTAPALTACTPTAGAVGSQVILTGTNLTGARAVYFGTVAATGFIVNSATQVTVAVPTGAMTSNITVVTATGGISNKLPFSVAAPALNNLSPTSGTVGTSVTISGDNFYGATAVSFNGTPATFTVLSANSIQATVPAGASSGNVTVTTPLGTSNGINFNVTVSNLVVSTGTMASPTTVPVANYTSITVTSTGVAQLVGTTFVSTAVQVDGTLLTNCHSLSGTGSFTLAAGGTLGICDAAGISASGSTGAVRTSGARSFSSDATYLYNGDNAQVTGTGLPATVRELSLSNPAGLTLSQSLSIRQRVQLTSGNLTLNGRALTLLSDASSTALVANTNGTVLGNTATLQRHIETNTTDSGYRHYASPVSGETVATLATAGYVPDFSGAAAYNTAATPGLVTPFPTVFFYNQDRIAGTASSYDTFSKGWQAASTADALLPGYGVAVQAPGTALVDFTGTLATGTQARSNLQRASADPNTGWHLLGNPYPSPLDWSTVTAAQIPGMDGAMYVYESSGPYAGSYRTYLTGAPGSTSPLIPAGAAFFVHTTAAGTPGSVSLTNANRVTEYGAQPAFGRSQEQRPALTLTLTAPGGRRDEALLYAVAAATPTVEPAFDAVKLANPSGLNLATLAYSGAALRLDGRPALAGRIALRLAVPATGRYTLAVALAHVPATTAVQLLDMLTGQTTDLRTAPAYAFTATAADPAEGRFFLLLTPAGAPLATAQAATHSLQLYPNPAHSALTVSGLAAHAPVAVLDALGRQVAHTTADANGTARLALPAGLAPSVYVVKSGAQAQRLVVE